MLKTMNQKVSIVLLAIAVFYLYMSYNLPTFAYTEIDANVIPTVLGWLLVILSVFLFFIKDSETEEQKERRNIPKKEIGMLLAVTAFILLYILLFDTLGFFIVTALFLFMCSWFLGYKNHIVNGIVSIVFPLLLYLLFTEFLRINLPQGILPF